MHPGSNYMLSATGILSPSTSLEVSLGRAANSLNYELQNEKLFRSAAGRDRRCRCCSPTRSRPTTSPGLPLPRRAHGQRRPVPDRPRPVHQREHHLRRPREPDEGLGIALHEVRRLLPAQLQAAEHLRELQQPDQLHRRREQPVRHRLRLRERGDRRLQHLHAGQQVRAARSGTTRTSSGTRRTTGRRAASSRSTTACASTT